MARKKIPGFAARKRLVTTVDITTMVVLAAESERLSIPIGRVIDRKFAKTKK